MVFQTSRYIFHNHIEKYMATQNVGAPNGGGADICPSLQCQDPVPIVIVKSGFCKLQTVDVCMTKRHSRHVPFFILYFS